MEGANANFEPVLEDVEQWNPSTLLTDLEMMLGDQVVHRITVPIDSFVEYAHFVLGCLFEHESILLQPAP